MKPANTILWLIISLMILPTAVSADIYHWRDEKGVDHYTNSSPPAGAEILLKESDMLRRSDEIGSGPRIEEAERAYIEKQEALEAELAEKNRSLQETVQRVERSIDEFRERLYEADRKAAVAERRVEDLQREASPRQDPEPRVEVYVEREYVPFFVEEGGRHFGKRDSKKDRDDKNPKRVHDGKRPDRKSRFDDDSGSSLQEKSRLRHASGIHTDRRLF